MSFPSFQRERYCAAQLVFEEQECNSRGFCLAAMHPTNEKMPTFTENYAFLISTWPARLRELKGHRLMDF